MQKNCPMCGRKLTWYDEGHNTYGECPVHGHVAGILRAQPLNFLDKIILRLQGIKLIPRSEVKQT